MKLKKILAVLLALALVCATFAACGDDASTSSASGESSEAAESGEEAESGETGNGDSDAIVLYQPREVDENRIINARASMEPTGLNTILSTYATEFTIIRHCYENLYMLDENNVPQPAAAETVDKSEDGLTFTFHLREDGVWTNGDPVTANDFAFAWQQVLTPENAADYAYFLYFIENAEAYLNGECEWEDVGVKVIDDKTLEVKLARPTPYAEFMFAFGTMAPVNQRFYEAVGADKYNTEAEYFCTNGAFAFMDWSHNESMILQKNENWHNADDIQVEQINFRIITDAQSALTSFLAGEIDYVDVNNGNLEKQLTDAGYELNKINPATSYYMMVNCENEYLSNVNLRRALALGFDKQAMIDLVYQNDNLPMTSFTPPAVFGTNNSSFQEALHTELGDLAPASGDVAAAQEYFQTALDELGITVDQLNGQIAIDCADDATTQAQAAFYQEQWRTNLGLEVNINPMLTKQTSSNRGEGNYDLSITGWSPDYNDPMTYLDLWVTGGGNNDSRWSNEEYDELIAQATEEADVDARQELFYQAEQIIFDEYPILPSYWLSQSYSYKTDKLSGGLRITPFQTNLAYAQFVA